MHSLWGAEGFVAQVVQVWLGLRYKTLNPKLLKPSTLIRYRTRRILVKKFVLGHSALGTGCLPAHIQKTHEGLGSGRCEKPGLGCRPFRV